MMTVQHVVAHQIVYRKDRLLKYLISDQVRRQAVMLICGFVIRARMAMA